MTMKLNRRSFVSLCIATFVLASGAFAAATAPERDQRRFEVGFLRMMIDHHFGAVKMSELCDGRTIHPELQEMCENIITNQTTEIQTMQGWLQSWYGMTYEPRLGQRGRKQVERLSRLDGEEFEKAYMSVMIEHHSVAAKMAINCLNEAYHAEMLNMCAKMLAMQGDEIVQLRLWLQQWYGIADPDRQDRL